MSVCNVSLSIDLEQTQVLRSHLKGVAERLFSLSLLSIFSSLSHTTVHCKLAFCYPVFIEHLLILTYYCIYLVFLHLYQPVSVSAPLNSEILSSRVKWK